MLTLMTPLGTICVILLIHISRMHLYVTWLSHVWHDSLMCAKTPSCVIWLIHMRRDGTHRMSWRWWCC